MIDVMCQTAPLTDQGRKAYNLGTRRELHLRLWLPRLPYDLVRNYGIKQS